MPCRRTPTVWPPSPIARAAGASEAEIQEAVEVVYLFGGTPALVTAMKAFRA